MSGGILMMILIAILLVYGIFILLSLSNNTISRIIWSPLLLIFSFNYFLKKEVIKETLLMKYVSYIQIFLNALKSSTYVSVVAVMLVQLESGTDSDKLAEILLVFLIVLGSIEILQVILSIIEEKKERLIKSFLYLVLLITIGTLSFVWIKDFLGK